MAGSHGTSIFRFLRNPSNCMLRYLFFSTSLPALVVVLGFWMATGLSAVRSNLAKHSSIGQNPCPSLIPQTLFWTVNVTLIFSSSSKKEKHLIFFFYQQFRNNPTMCLCLTLWLKHFYSSILRYYTLTVITMQGNRLQKPLNRNIVLR